jgi:hypothetical protein
LIRKLTQNKKILTAMLWRGSSTPLKEYESVIRLVVQGQDAKIGDNMRWGFDSELATRAIDKDTVDKTFS